MSILCTLTSMGSHSISNPLPDPYYFFAAPVTHRKPNTSRRNMGLSSKLFLLSKSKHSLKLFKVIILGDDDVSDNMQESAACFLTLRDP
ncbi:hypothetical protein IAQ61_002431 [Plenodomus lingam]|uniref:uncharacterized protein n=1 Tax=Leptosphaeria maculans TaxID=5022 RepID=UPI0033337C65|nr:hypothetical protein IAQ61_002431 [Plenodomus lingam]